MKILIYLFLYNLLFIIMEKQSFEQSQSQQYQSSESRSRRSKSKFSTSKSIQNKKNTFLIGQKKIISCDVPISNKKKLILASNLKGDGFVLKQKDLQIFQVAFQVKENIRNCIREINMFCFSILTKHKLERNHTKFSKYNVLLTILFIITSLIVFISGFDPDFFTKNIMYVIIMLYLISIAVLVLVIFVYGTKYAQRKVNKIIEDGLKKKLILLNETYYFEKNLQWKVNREFFWISVKAHDHQST